MSFVVGGITLPLSPDRIVEDNPAEYKSSAMPGKLPLIVSVGKKERKITLEGYLYSMGSSIATLLSSYIQPLRLQVYRVVAFSDPDGVYTGEYILEDFYHERTKDYPLAFRFRILLSQGSVMMPLLGMVLDKTYGPIGTVVTAYVTALTPSSALTATIGGDAVSLTGGATNTKGNAQPYFTVPTITTGEKIVRIVDGSGKPVTATFRVDAT